MDWNQIKRVVAPIDLEDADPQGIRLALQAAVSADGVHVLYVLPEVEPSLLTQIDDGKRLSNARTALRTWLQEHGYPDEVRTHVRVGNAAPLIAMLAETVEAELVILPSHGRKGLRRALMGSVSERATRLCPCPVLVLKRPQT
jgi:nucleotide-binding universal stress UspA family protein